MNIEVFSLCDGAYNYSGKLTIVGTYDQLNVQNVPFSARVSLAVKLCFNNNEIHNGSAIRVSFKNSLGTLVSPEITNTIGVLPDGTQVRHVAMALNANLNILEAGVYKVELYVDDLLIGEKEFNVVVSQ